MRNMSLAVTSHPGSLTVILSLPFRIPHPGDNGGGGA